MKIKEHDLIMIEGAECRVIGVYQNTFSVEHPALGSRLVRKDDWFIVPLTRKVVRHR
ncbi:MAG: hypothetical protein LBV67_07100 [Streptococcaceae bacterium]|jgi:hypothetical protein|nr:hypothetical protein [Streptococcaceae bacterium]